MEYTFREFLCRKSGLLGSLLKSGLAVISKIFGSIVGMRNFAYDKGILQSSRPHQNTLIISIGNLQAGGAGKTPFALMLSKYFINLKQTAILSRGYRSKLSSKTPLIINDRDGLIFSPLITGDEPSLLAKHLPNAYIVIGKDRLASAQYIADKGARVLLLDDGFQHRKLERDEDIVLIDASLPDEAKHLLPRGLLREKEYSLSRASLVVVTKAVDQFQYEEIQQKIKLYTKAPIIGAELVVARICSSCAKVEKDLSNKKGALFCGIANPSSFVNTIESLGVEIVSKHCFADHTGYKQEQICEIAEKAKNKGAALLICTEKDAVKILPWINSLPLPVVWPEMEMQVKYGVDVWDRWLKELIVKAKECI